MNPYYEPESLELEMVSFDEPDLSYEYNTLCFWATKDGKVFSASDSGCSCPTPFEDSHDRATRDDVLQTLERVGSKVQGLRIFDSWNCCFDTHLPQSKRDSLSLWLEDHIKA